MVKKQRKPVKKPPVKGKTKKVSGGKSTLEDLVLDLNEKYGQNVVTLGVPKENRILKRVPTGIPSLDIDLGGGIPIGRVISIAGGFSVAKTTLGLHFVAAFQRHGYKAMFADVEATSGSENYLGGIGVKSGELIYTNPASLEETLNLILDIQKRGIIKVALWDCLIVTKPNKVVDKNIGDSVQMGVMQTQLDEFFSKLAMNNNKLVREGQEPFTLIVLNQLREKPTQYGNPEYTPGGRAKDHAFSVDIRLRRAEYITEGTGTNKSIVGQRVAYKTEKNKTYKRMQEGELDLYVDENVLGIPKYNFDIVKSLITEAVSFGLIKKGGKWYEIDPATKFDGFDKMVEYLREKEDAYRHLEKEVLKLGSKE